MNAKEELTKLLMESYDRGVKDAKQEALTALEKVVAVMVADEREACAQAAAIALLGADRELAERVVRAIRNLVGNGCWHGASTICMLMDGMDQKHDKR